MTDLAQAVDRRVDQPGVVGSDDSESENESDPIQQSAATGAPLSRPGKLKIRPGGESYQRGFVPSKMAS